MTEHVGNDGPEDANPDADTEFPIDADAPEEEFPEKGPLRRCVATGVVQAKDGMIRFVVGPDGSVVPDLEEKLPGRGLWLTADEAAVTLAIRRKAFSKAARRAVSTPDDLLGALTGLLERRCLDRIGLARRAGQVIAGYEKVREALRTRRVGRTGEPALLIEAADGSPEQRSKVTALAPDLPVIALFPRDALAAALGREVAAHAVMARGGLADGLRRDAARLAGLRNSVVGTSRPDVVTTY